ncbi:hypothetical protein AHAS_Ahas01G0158000 [Arachis hypogaea]
MSRVSSIDADAQVARARRFKIWDNPKTRRALRRSALLPLPKFVFFVLPPPTSVAAAPPATTTRPTPSQATHALSLVPPPTPEHQPPQSLLSAQTPPPHHHLRRLHHSAGDCLPLLSPPSHSPITTLFHRHRTSPPFLFLSITPAATHLSGHRPRRRKCCFCCPTPYFSSIFNSSAPRMSDKGKAIATTSKKRKHSTPSISSIYKNYAKNPLNDVDKENQQLPSTNPDKFPNLYCELRFSKYRTTKLNIEKKLLLPTDVRRSITGQILELGIHFVERDLGDINVSWVKEFYCNFFRPTLDSVQVRGREIMITETAIEEALQCRHVPDELCAHQQAELAIHSMTFDYEALRTVIGLPDATWVMDANNTKPKGMLFTHLTREAKTWQMIFACYVLPTTHFSEIPMEMLLLIGCVMEGKEVSFPRLI